MTTESIVSENPWEALSDRPLRLRSGLRFRAEGPGNDWICFLEDTDSGRSYAMSHWQRWLLELIEKKTPVRDAAHLVVSCYPDLVSPESAVRFIQWLVSVNLLEEVSTFRVESSKAVGESEPESGSHSWIKGLRWPRIRHLAMNGVAALLIAIGISALNPGFQASEAAGEVSPFSFASGDQVLETARLVPVRAVTAGILAEVFVRDGDEVDAGDLIARIEDPEVIYQLQDLKLRLGECRVRRDRYFHSGNHEDYTAEMRRIAALSREIGIHEAQANLSELRAPVAGLIETEVLCGHVGSEVVRGDVLLRVHPENSPDSDLLAGNP